MSISKYKPIPKASLIAMIITVAVLLTSCSSGGGGDEVDYTPSLSDLSNLTYTRPVDDLLPLGNYVYTFNSGNNSYTETTYNTSGAFSYTENSNLEAVIIFHKPAGSVTDTLTFTGNGTGTFVSDETGGVNGNFTLN